MPRGYDALRDVLQAANSPTQHAQTKPHIKNLLNSDDRPLHRVSQSAPLTSPARTSTEPSPIDSPSTSHRSPSTMPPAPPLVPAPIPYNPTRRTPPTSVLIPLTPAELESFKIPRHALRAHTRPDPALLNPNFFPPSTHQSTSNPHKRKRADDDDSSVSSRSRDVGLVVNHYNARPDVGNALRRESPIIALRSFNNWVKSVLFTKFAKPVFAGCEERDRLRGRVLDIGCGKGGDLSKWQRIRIRGYVGVDIAAVSVDQARSRWLALKGRPFEAQFAALDCYTEPLTAALSPETLAWPFDVVSMQFCMHYAFESVTKARMMLENVSKYLRKGGVFLGTVPNAELLMQRLGSLPAGAPPLFGNSVYQIQFEDHNVRPQLFGHRYWFFLKDAVDNVPEYVVEWTNFEQLATEHGLHLIYKQQFHEMFVAERNHHEYGRLLERMDVVSTSGQILLDDDQWEAANIYLAFAFKKL